MKVEQEIGGSMTGLMAGRDIRQTRVGIHIGEGQGDGGVVIGAVFNGPVHFHLSVSNLPDEEIPA